MSLPCNQGWTTLLINDLCWLPMINQQCFQGKLSIKRGKCKKQYKRSHFKMESELPPQRNVRLVGLTPQTLCMLKLGKMTSGTHLRQYCIPKSCLQIQQESRHHDYWTENWRHPLELASLYQLIWTYRNSFLSLLTSIEIPSFYSYNYSPFLSQKNSFLSPPNHTIFVSAWITSSIIASLDSQINAYCFSL